MCGLDETACPKLKAEPEKGDHVTVTFTQLRPLRLNFYFSFSRNATSTNCFWCNRWCCGAAWRYCTGNRQNNCNFLMQAFHIYVHLGYKIMQFLFHSHWVLRYLPQRVSRCVQENTDEKVDTVLVNQPWVACCCFTSTTNTKHSATNLI